MTSTARPIPRAVSSTATRVGILVATVAVAVALNSVIAALAIVAGAPRDWAPLSAPVYGAFTVIPMVIGWFAWRFVSRRVRNPRRTLLGLAAAVLVVSFVPDIVLAATGFIPGTTAAGVVGLMAMHVVVVATATAGFTIASR